MGNFLVSHALGLESVNPARKCQKTRRKGVGCRFWVEKTWFGLKVVSSSSGRISHVVLFQARDFRAQTRRFERGALENWRRRGFGLLQLDNKLGPPHENHVSRSSCLHVRPTSAHCRLPLSPAYCLLPPAR
ncbi:hypothetical protein VDGL01_04060 [Verticillium dahliae]